MKKKKNFFHPPTLAKMKKKFFQINIEKNGPIAGPKMESCPGQCMVCPDAKKNARIFIFIMLFFILLKKQAPSPQERILFTLES